MLSGLLGLFAMGALIHHYNDILGVLARATIFERFIELFSGGDRSYRLGLYLSALQIWVDSPSSFIFGRGLGSFPLMVGLDPVAGWYPHNFILECIAEGGVVASVPLFVLLFKFISGFARPTPLEFNRLFFQNFSLYGLCAYMFMGGLASVWLPCFALALYLFTFE